MATLNRCSRLLWREGILLLFALVCVVAVLLGLTVLPFRTYRSLFTAAKRQLLPSVPPDRVTWATSVVCRYVPGPACLAKSQAAELLLSWCGGQSCTRFGVARAGLGEIRAHAWLEVNGKVVMGGTDPNTFTVLSEQPL